MAKLFGQNIEEKQINDTLLMIISSRSLFESDYVAYGCNRNVIALVHTGGLWSFPTDLSNEGLQDTKEKYKTSDAMKLIEMLCPDVMVQHVQCERRHQYSALFEILNIPIIGSDSQVSANIVDKGKKLKIVQLIVHFAGKEFQNMLMLMTPQSFLYVQV